MGLPADERAGPGEAGAERGDADEHPGLELARLESFVEADRDGRGGGVAKSLDRVEDFVVVLDPELLGREIVMRMLA